MDLLELAASLDAKDAKRPAWNPSRRQRDAARERDYERMEPVALDLARSAGARGFTADDLRSAAIAAGVLVGDEGRATGQQRALSWLGPFLCSLARREQIIALTYRDGARVKRESERVEAKGNLQVVYVAIEHSRVIS
jgi:hypothetical protein